MKRIPIIPTIIVLLAVALMVRLGFWQLDRLHQKEALLTRYAAAQKDVSPMAKLPLNEDLDNYLYRHVNVTCSKVTGWESVTGRNSSGEAGFAHIALCNLADRFTFDGPGYDVPIGIGWSRYPANPNWGGGQVTGVIGPFRKGEVKIIADPPLAGLQANAQPDPSNIPNNHLSYAAQWFLFAATALVIYGLALRKRWRVEGN